jgi:hypothetical protein
LHGGDARQGGGGDVPDESHVGEVQDNLDSAVRHEWQGERKHSALIDMRPAGRIDTLCRQGAGNVYGFNTRAHPVF